ncbi:MAG: hypothetical protein KDL87_19750, partial [Verrucomicrobiae bacterium]|nr:hypothetical protein [Verrucomicrobiae bacterium]
MDEETRFPFSKIGPVARTSNNPSGKRDTPSNSARASRPRRCNLVRKVPTNRSPAEMPGTHKAADFFDWRLSRRLTPIHPG